MKELILNKATDLFLNFGFKSVTMDQIANEIGISKKTIYNFKPDAVFHFAAESHVDNSIKNPDKVLS